ncbi:isoleucine--tRNA ligase [Candidatus Methylacidiphilum infernorum]|uniref:Isoleucine--tRNA ligase n=1 Tax=Methylacidiphilum infernorum (isolate V4) TaxID=481448 RepID=SYI_METI4|nr:isoleucine--tRNA ligase [Candidatus Methylacidiphilum infernorum]B3DYQ6.1 RecName: Full=Isoleucine--tRNA ligase; AltName: Full=Isoleucyl-tRNA synthetase; Short=IleRS [Methylacidiphilum infernorum V4]ACD82428.1 Isoleucyl-tRNA synthetase [Methylacidiphilum infernorum V4]
MDYSLTVLLPKTDFPMKANLPQREPHWIEVWEKEKVYSTLLEKRKNCPQFILHDGPPFANGKAHMGSGLNKILKDIVLKSRNMLGFQCPYIPGWDCHGLPIEHKVMSEYPALAADPLSIRNKCKEYARYWIEIQKEQFRRLGILGSWDNPYITMDPGYEAAELRLFAELVEKKWVYRGLRPVFWSVGCRTALAEAEIEYQKKEDIAIYVEFPVGEEELKKAGLPQGTSFLAWTTTPWTLPANLALAVSPDLSYELRQVGGKKFIVAGKLAESIPGFSHSVVLLSFPSGQNLEGLKYNHPLLPREGVVYTADFVSGETGSGIVHIAPGHGMEDYQLGMVHGLEVYSPVDDQGRFTKQCGIEKIVGLSVFEANSILCAMLKEKGLLWAKYPYVHDYPFCWRSKTPIIFRSVPQWFIAIEAFKSLALKEIERVNWIPSRGENRIKGAVESRKDWCISRQRYWGVPIPAFYKKSGEAILDPSIIRRFADKVEEEGTDLWFRLESKELCQLLGLAPSEDLVKGLDTLDVWIDSGSSHYSVLKPRGEDPADLYLEGSDQHRGWFQSSLLLSVASKGKAPYKSVLTHGFVVDLDGKKLSKSSGARDLSEQIQTYGADLLRLWVASEEYAEDVPFSKEIFSRLSDSYRLIRNSLRILLGNLHDFNPQEQSLPDDRLREIDRYFELCVNKLVKKTKAFYENYEFSQVYQALTRFCSVELSSFYIDILKDRLYCDGQNWLSRRSAQTVLYRTFECLVKLLAPILPFTTEEAWRASGKTSSIHLELFPEEREIKEEEKLLKRWEKILQLRDLANRELEKARKQKMIGKNLEAKLILFTDDFEAEDTALLTEVFLVSQLEIIRSSKTEILVEKALGKKCPRCWKFSLFAQSNSDPQYPHVCPRCLKVLKGLPESFLVSD